MSFFCACRRFTTHSAQTKRIRVTTSITPLAEACHIPARQEFERQIFARVDVQTTKRLSGYTCTDIAACFPATDYARFQGCMDHMKPNSNKSSMPFETLLVEWGKSKVFETDLYIVCPETETSNTLGVLLKGVTECGFMPDTHANEPYQENDGWKTIPTGDKWVLCEITEAPSLMKHKLMQLERAVRVLGKNDDFNKNKIGALVVLVNGDKATFLEEAKKLVFPRRSGPNDNISMPRISDYPLMIGWTPYRNVYTEIGNLKQLFEDLKSDVLNMKSDMHNMKSDMHNMKSDMHNIMRLLIVGGGALFSLMGTGIVLVVFVR